MKEKGPVVLVLAVVLLSGGALWATLSWAAPGGLLAPPEVIPPVVAYQGEVHVGGSPYTGHGYFKFAVVDAAGATTYWSNDGSSGDGGEPTEAVPLEVTEGLFSVLLGDTTLAGMAEPLAAEVFGEPECHLRVWFSAAEGGPFEQLAPDTRIAAVPYALRAQEAVNADTVDGLHASQLGADYQNVVVVAKSGGDYASVQAAIDSITDAAADNAYLVWVAPGVYSEAVTMKAHVHLQGAGQEATVISSAASSEAWPPTEATLRLASDASLRDLTVGNSGTGDRNVALLANAGMTGTLVADVTARAQGGGVYNYAIVLTGAGTEVTLQQVTAVAENGSYLNLGLLNDLGARATLGGGSFTGRGGNNAWAIQNYGEDTKLEAEGVTALGENGIYYSYGLYNAGGASATLRGGSFTGLGAGSGDARGVKNTDYGTTLVAENVVALGEGGAYNSNGLWNDGGVARLRGGSFTGRGGTDAHGIHNVYSATILDAESIAVLGEYGSGTSFGLFNFEGAEAMLTGGSFTARGGEQARGIANDGSGSQLGADSVTALGEDATDSNYGLRNERAAAATLRGGSFIGHGGAFAWGILNLSSATILDAEGAIGLGADALEANTGLGNEWAVARLRGGSFTGRGGGEAGNSGIVNYGSGAILEAEGVTVRGEDGLSNFGLFNSSDAPARMTQCVVAGASASIYRPSGDVTVSNSRLVGGAVDGTVTCILVTRDGNISTDGATCP